MPGYRAATGTATPCGGWTGPGSWARPSTRCTTRGWHAGRRPCSYRAAPITRSAWMRWRRAGCGWPAGWARGAARGRAFPRPPPPSHGAPPQGGGGGPGRADPPAPFTAPAGPVELDLRRAGIGTVIWAAGYKPAYPWLRVPVLDRHGEDAHHRGVTSVPGLYVLGLAFLYRRNSTFIDGVAADARFVAAHVMMRRMAARAQSA